MSRFSVPIVESEEIAQLRDRVRALEIRLDRIEREGVLPVTKLEEKTSHAPVAIAACAAAGPVTPAPMDTEIAAATVFKRVAMLCFVLLGALILRVLTQQNILGVGFGTVLGFVYTAHLIVLSLFPGRFGAFARESSLFQCSGAMLAFFIVIESAVRTQTMGRISGLLTIGGFALLALGMAIYQRKSALAGVGIIGGILALVALDLKEPGVALQLGLVVLLAAAGVSSSWRKGWDWLRPTTTVLILLLMPAGLSFCGKEPGVTGGVLVASAAVWCLAMVQHLVALHRLRGAAAWLPVTTLWLAGIQQVAGWPLLGTTTGGLAVFALAFLIICARLAPAATAGLAGIAAASAFAGVIGWGMLDRTGLLCAIGAMGLWFAGRRVVPDWSAGFATLLMLASAAVGLAQLFRPPVPVACLAAMGASALILALHYVCHGRTGAASYSGLPMRLSPVALAAALALLLGVFWELLNRLFQQPAHLLLSQTVVIVITALALTFWGHAAQRRSPLFCGLACMALALIKVLVVDLMRLKSVNMLASLVLVSLASVAVSLILRRRGESAPKAALESLASNVPSGPNKS